MSRLTSQAAVGGGVGGGSRTTLHPAMTPRAPGLEERGALFKNKFMYTSGEGTVTFIEWGPGGGQGPAYSIGGQQGGTGKGGEAAEGSGSIPAAQKGSCPPGPPPSPEPRPIPGVLWVLGGPRLSQVEALGQGGSRGLRGAEEDDGAAAEEGEGGPGGCPMGEDGGAAPTPKYCCGGARAHRILTRRPSVSATFMRTAGTGSFRSRLRAARSRAGT